MTQVRPILESSCVRCHGADRAEDSIRIDTQETAQEFITPGSADTSDLYTVLVLPDHDKRAMPIRDRDQLSELQIAIIKQWIDAGAKWPDDVVLKPAWKIQFSTMVSILQTNCTICHSAGKPEGGLRLDDRSAALAGGVSGPAFVPFDPAASPLYSVLVDPKPHHRPKFFDPEHLKDLRTWIEQGAVWPTANERLEVPRKSTIDR